MSAHLAAVCPAKGRPFEIQSRPTPKPGPGELLIAVKSVALNPADSLMREGLLIPSYPVVIGFDISGLVLDIGEDVPTGHVGDGSGISFQPGVTRVAAYAAFFWRSFSLDYGAFQECCLVPWQHAVPILRESMSWNEAATLPVAVQVPLLAWDVLKIPRPTLAIDISPKASTLREKNGPGTLHEKREALLIWGASSSVGTMGVQSGRLLKEDVKSPIAAVYATAGSANMDYVACLGADRVFDHRDPRVVDKIIFAAQEDGLSICRCFLAIGQLSLCQAVLKAFLDVEQEAGGKGMIASAPPVFPNADMINGVDVVFLQPSTSEEERLQQFRYWMGTWLRDNLTKASIRPSPELTVVGKGLEAINTGLDTLQQGVSCTKLVVEIAE